MNANNPRQLKKKFRLERVSSLVFACFLLFLIPLSWSTPLPGLPEREQPTEETSESQRFWFSWQEINFWILQKQREFHRGLAATLEDISVKKDGQKTWVLIFLSFLYGVFHAAGPGHGKAVLTTYLVTQPEKLRRGLVLSFIAALLQGVTAILLVTILVQLLGRLAREAFSSVIYVEMASFAVIALLGLGLLVTAVRRGYRQWKAHQQKHVLYTATPLQPLTAPNIQLPEQPAAICSSCGKVHHVAPEQVEGQSFLKNTGLLLSIGLRPCSGAVLVLVVANLLGLWWIGVAAVLAMALGTSITVMLLALLAVKARDWARHLLKLQRKGFNHWGNLLAGLGGLLLFLLGLSLLFNLSRAEHPLGIL